MGSSDRWNYVNQSPIARGSLPGGYDVVNMGHGNQGIIEFDNISGLQRRVGTRPLYEDLLRQGCTPTGQRSGPPGFESDVYNCPNSPAGSPAWFQDRHGRETVFGGVGMSSWYSLGATAAETYAANQAFLAEFDRLLKNLQLSVVNLRTVPSTGKEAALAMVESDLVKLEAILKSSGAAALDTTRKNSAAAVVKAAIADLDKYTNGAFSLSRATLPLLFTAVAYTPSVTDTAAARAAALKKAQSDLEAATKALISFCNKWEVPVKNGKLPSTAYVEKLKALVTTIVKIGNSTASMPIPASVKTNATKARDRGSKLLAQIKSKRASTSGQSTQSPAPQQEAECPAGTILDIDGVCRYFGGDDQVQEQGFWQLHKTEILIGIGAIVLVGGAAYVLRKR